MVDYGVTSIGFVKKTYDVIIVEKKAKAKEQFGVDVDLEPTSPLMKFIEVTTLEEVRLWDMAESLYHSAYLDYCSGDQLDKVCALLGITRKSATKAIGVVTFTGTGGTVVSAGTKVTTSTGIEFSTDSEVTLDGGTADANITANEAGVDGNVAANTITILQDPIFGIDSVNNAVATSGGTDKEFDGQMRYRASVALDVAGRGTINAIVGAVLDVAGVISVNPIENLTNHTLNLVVYGVSPPNTDVDDAIQDYRPAGISVSWQATTYVDIYVDTTVSIDSDNAPSDAATQIKTKIVDYINSLGPGDDVIYNKLIDEIFEAGEYDDQNWVTDVTVLKVDTVTPPVGTTNVAIADTEKAQSDSAKVDVTTT